MPVWSFFVFQAIVAYFDEKEYDLLSLSIILIYYEKNC